MKLRWKIALGLLGTIVLIGGGGLTYILNVSPPPAKLVEPGPTGRRIDTGGLLANFYPAKGEGRHPAVLLIGGSEGGLSKDVQAVALLLQAQGLSTIQLAYHNAPGKSAKLVNIPLEEFYRALDWLKQQPGIDANRLAIVGASKGAEAGLLVATRYPGIRAAVLGMPSSVVWDGMSGANYILGSFSSSWSEKDEPVPHLAYKGKPNGNVMLPVFVNGLKELDRNPAAEIPVEKYKGKLMLVCGEADTLWPSCSMTDQIVERAKRNGARLPVVLRYKDAGHGVMGAPVKDPAQAKWIGKMGGSREGNMAARAASWPKIVELLRIELAVGSQ